MKNKGITLVALIITIIILLILAGITIGQLTGNGIFDMAKGAKEKYENAQNQEEEIIGQYENAISGKYVSESSRDMVTLTTEQYNSLINRITTLENKNSTYTTKSLINTDDELYDSVVGGYEFDTPTTFYYYETRPVINLNDNVTKYDYVLIEFNMYYYESGYTTKATTLVSTKNLNSDFDIRFERKGNWNEVDAYFSRRRRFNYNRRCRIKY